MNYNTKTPQFKEYEETFGSTFAAIKYISLLARKRCNEVNHCITESQALSWVVTGEEPADLSKYRAVQKAKKHKIKYYTKDRLMYIEDTEVRTAVSFSIDESRRQGYLVYVYGDIQDTCRQSRVRVLTNMVWDELRQLEMEEI